MEPLKLQEPVAEEAAPLSAVVAREETASVERAGLVKEEDTAAEVQVVAV
jgi:hypothetical protein